MTGKQLRIASWIDAAMQAFAQTGEDDMAVLADMEQCSHFGLAGKPAKVTRLFRLPRHGSDWCATREGGGLVLLDAKPRVSMQR